MLFEKSDAVEIKECLACGSSQLEMTLDLNSQPLANSYKIQEHEVQQEFPLAINRCEHCYHVQLTHAVNPELMFKDYLYVSSTTQTMKEHFKWFADFTIEYFKFSNRGIDPIGVLDIGCNDGSQLDQYTCHNMRTAGIDPAENLYEESSKRHNIYCGYFDKNFLSKRKEINYDIIVAQNVFAHNYDPLNFLLTIKEIVLDNSLIFIQTSQSDMIVNNEFDTIYHEHISFYNINSMNEICKRADLNLIDVIKCPLHGNSYIFIIAKGISRPQHIENLIDMERKAGLLSDATYKRYAEKCNQIATNLRNEIVKAKNLGHKVIGYGAAAKGMTLLNYADVHLDYIIDDNPLKQNRYTPGTSIPIVSCDILTKFNKDDTIIFVPLAWNFFSEIKDKIKVRRNNQKDKFLKYFPEVEYVE